MLGNIQADTFVDDSDEGRLGNNASGDLDPGRNRTSARQPSARVASMPKSSTPTTSSSSSATSSYNHLYKQTYSPSTSNLKTYSSLHSSMSPNSSRAGSSTPRSSSKRVATLTDPINEFLDRVKVELFWETSNLDPTKLQLKHRVKDLASRLLKKLESANIGNNSQARAAVCIWLALDSCGVKTTPMKVFVNHSTLQSQTFNQIVSQAQPFVNQMIGNSEPGTPGTPQKRTTSLQNLGVKFGCQEIVPDAKAVLDNYESTVPAPSFASMREVYIHVALYLTCKAWNLRKTLDEIIPRNKHVTNACQHMKTTCQSVLDEIKAKHSLSKSKPSAHGQSTPKASLRSAKNITDNTGSPDPTTPTKGPQVEVVLGDRPPSSREDKDDNNTGDDGVGVPKRVVVSLKRRSARRQEEVPTTPTHSNSTKQRNPGTDQEFEELATGPQRRGFVTPGRNSATVPASPMTPALGATLKPKRGMKRKAAAAADDDEEAQPAAGGESEPVVEAEVDPGEEMRRRGLLGRQSMMREDEMKRRAEKYWTWREDVLQRILKRIVEVEAEEAEEARMREQEEQMIADDDLEIEYEQAPGVNIQEGGGDLPRVMSDVLMIEGSDGEEYGEDALEDNVLAQDDADSLMDDDDIIHVVHGEF